MILSHGRDRSWKRNAWTYRRICKNCTLFISKKSTPLVILLIPVAFLILPMMHCLPSIAKNYCQTTAAQYPTVVMFLLELQQVAAQRIRASLNPSPFYLPFRSQHKNISHLVARDETTTSLKKTKRN
uniref:Uncharacterized protein n=1 Tax=Cacopsylla melanoneura TaxID=428564 RepID=A0A8D9BLY2_9HEMI